MARKPVPRLPSEDPPPYQCSQCWFYDPIEIDHGACYVVPPYCILDKDGDPMYPRPIVMSDDRGCHLFKPRHTA